MRLRNFALVVSLLQVCFMLAVRSAKADTITIVDTTDTTTVTLTGGNDTFLGGGTVFTCAETAPCIIDIRRAGATQVRTSLNFLLSYTLAEPSTPTQESDTLDTSTVGAGPEFTFNSDRPPVGGTEATLGPCPSVAGVPTCSATEAANGNLVPGFILWEDSNGIPVGPSDTVIVQSDIEAGGQVPEPSSLILFGSGLAIAGGFLRRRRRVVMPSVVA